MTFNPRNPLLLPEIARHVASLCSFRERRDWAYACKTLFGATIPIIWDYVYCIEHLLKLIPGVQVVKEPDPSEGSNVIRTIILDERALTGDWGRYWHYAPLVRRLSIFFSYLITDDSIRVRGWHFLFSKLKEGALLPNLRTLEVEMLYKSSQFDRLAWSALFLSPSLRVLDLDDGFHEHQIDPRLPSNSVSLLLAALSESLPAQSKNALPFQYKCPSEHALASVCPTEYQEGYRWFNSIPNLVHLKELGITVSPNPKPVWDALCVVGHLPLLERLKLKFGPNYQDEPKGGYDFNHVLPRSPTLFPSLRKLFLEEVPDARVFRWIWSLKPLVSQISSARVGRSYEFTIDPQEFDTNIIQPMRQGSPSLTVLSVAVYRRDRIGFLEMACKLMFQIPLEELELTGLRQWDIYPAIYQATTCPHLRCLRFTGPFEPEKWRELIYLAKALPNLEYLFIWPILQILEAQDPNGIIVEHPALQPIKIDIREPVIVNNLTSAEGSNHIISLVQ
ncbi:unnamed protein product [Rhizoctonia solani]|uniref:Uncharacterized protein n=1 Tax=Rhizoctonia solani TaxID=456999 RepID=A0A8H3E677_9AGAM|nr:unnamed protein product [Rhizoctonia solani]